MLIQYIWALWLRLFLLVSVDIRRMDGVNGDGTEKYINQMVGLVVMYFAVVRLTNYCSEH